MVVFADGRTVWGRGFGAEGQAVGELCFNTAMTGYQEIMTDPSFARQIIAFTFPHIGNVGANEEDVEAGEAHALGCLVREAVTSPSNFRSQQDFPGWMAATGRIGISGVDTRALTRLVRAKGRRRSRSRIRRRASSTSTRCSKWRPNGRGWRGWTWRRRFAGCSSRLGPAGNGAGDRIRPSRRAGGEEARSAEGEGLFTPTLPASRSGGRGEKRPHVVAIDYGAKRNIFRNLVEAGARVTVVPATATFDEIMAHKPDGFFLSNGPGDPAATGEYAIPVIRGMLESGKPLFGICLGHQLLALAVGGKTSKMFQGHRGANHPVKRLADGAVEITSMNHGFAVERQGLPNNVRETHVSLFDDSNCGIELTDRPAFSVQYHPEASPGPQDSFYLFEKFVGMMR